MDVGVDHMRDLHVLLGGLRQEPVLVAKHRIDRDSDMAAAAAEQIGQRCLLGGQSAKEHVSSVVVLESASEGQDLVRPERSSVRIRSRVGGEQPTTPPLRRRFCGR